MKINKKAGKMASDLRLRLSGAKGTRTPDPLLAKQVLFQLSYSPRKPTSVVPHISLPCWPSRSPACPGW
jgi:hypothetical protein